MDNQGFTMKDVFVILFINIIFTMIMAFIATNATMSSIEKAKQGSARDAGYGFIKAAEYSMAGSKNDKDYVLPTNIVTDDISGIPIKGVIPTSVNLNASNGLIKGGTITIDGYILTIDAKGVLTAKGKAPTVKKPTINYVKLLAAKEAGYGFIRAAEYSIARATMETSGYVKPIYITTGDIADISMKGIKPTVAELSLNNGLVAGGIIKINGYTLIVDSSGEIINR